MTLVEFNLLTQSIAAVLFSLCLIMIILGLIPLYKRITTILDQIDHISQTGRVAADSVKTFVEDTTHKISAFSQAFLTVKGATEVVSTVGEAIKKAKAANTAENTIRDPNENQKKGVTP